MNKLVYRSYKESDNMKIINEFEINNDFGCNNYVARSNSIFRSFRYKKGEQVKIEIKSCKQCPHFTTDNWCSSDGWDRMEIGFV